MTAETFRSRRGFEQNDVKCTAKCSDDPPFLPLPRLARADSLTREDEKGKRTKIHIAACNRTLYGDVGRTYRVEIRRPREDRLPFLCHLNFTAAGADLGDLVQVGRDEVVVENNADWYTYRRLRGRARARVCHREQTTGSRPAAPEPVPDNNLCPGFYDSYRVYWRN